MILRDGENVRDRDGRNKRDIVYQERISSPCALEFADREWVGQHRDRGTQ